VHDIRRLDALTSVRGVRKLRFGAAIRNLGRRLDVDVVHAHGILPYAFWAAQADVHPLVVSPWGRDVLVDAKVEPGRRRARTAFAAADWIVVNSEAIARAAVEAGAPADRMTHLIWHTNLDGFGPECADKAALRRQFSWPEESIVVLSLRNMQQRANVDVLVRAFARAQAAEPHARLLIAARGGAHKATVQAVVDNLRLGDVVAFHRVEPEGLPELVASGDIVVSIASTDSSPSSLLEAMASSQPLIGGWCPSIDEWIGPGQGAEMVECRDEDAVTAALLRLIRDPALRQSYGERNRRVVRTLVSESGPALEALYSRLAEHRGLRPQPPETAPIAR
jgi:glycosyltransferase involved in cell wall biosynthesis